MTNEELTKQIIDHEHRLSSNESSLKSAHKRIDENDRITEGIHKIASSVEALALQVKLLTERVDQNINKIEESLKSQGERISKIEKEPGENWKKAVWQVVSLVIAAVTGCIMTKLL